MSVMLMPAWRASSFLRLTTSSLHMTNLTSSCLSMHLSHFVSATITLAMPSRAATRAATAFAYLASGSFTGTWKMTVCALLPWGLASMARSAASEMMSMRSPSLTWPSTTALMVLTYFLYSEESSVPGMSTTVAGKPVLLELYRVALVVTCSWLALASASFTGLPRADVAIALRRYDFPTPKKPALTMIGCSPPSGLNSANCRLSLWPVSPSKRQFECTRSWNSRLVAGGCSCLLGGKK
mmetsp:Transcript_17571/g.68156  ORF Transcript_17571/g.68156 Transcript_17571/m.68156 type:complete len:239 (-) Transcript_17571:80-796(-)